MRVTMHIASKDRHSELGLLLQSLRTQTFQNFDIIILDDASGSPISDCYFLQVLLNRMKLEGHKVKVLRVNESFGVCYARNFIIDNDDFLNELSCRVDDDVVLEPDYLHKLYMTIVSGFDIASGVTPVMVAPELKREVEFVKPVVNEIRLNESGEIVKYNDDCGFGYLQEEILPADQFRSCAMIKSKIYEQVKYPTNLSPVGFREEAFFSVKASRAKFKIGVHTGAIAYHIQTPSGGCRYPNYGLMVQSDQNVFEDFMKFKKVKE